MKALDKFDDDFYHAGILSTLLGGGMSSRLFQSVREKHGLAYSVYSSHSGYKDSGQFEIYVGTDPDKLQKLMPVLINEINDISQNNVSIDELNRAKAQLKSSLLMGQESMLSRANRQAKYMINFNKVLNIQDLIDKIDCVEIDHIQTMGQKIFSSKPTIASLGPISEMPDYDLIAQKLAA